MTAREIFDGIAPLVAPLLEAEFDRRDSCILATRVAIETAAYFGIEARPQPVKVMLLNATFARHVAEGFAGVDRNQPCSTWGDDSWGVGIGMGKPNEPNRWDGHLIAVADGAFGDFSIQQAERLQRNIYTGPALVGPYHEEDMWRAIHEPSGTVVEYSRTLDNQWRNAPDWKDEARRRPIVGKLVRALRAREVSRS
jgi:hypothetical protein